MAQNSCSYCGTFSGEINVDIYTEKYYCENENCIKKARKETKEYFKQREIKISKDFKITEITSEEEFEKSSKYFETIAKQIQKKLDKLIDRKTIEQKRIAGELKFVNNKRKLSNYKR